jgi:hypothetical protein
LDDIRTEHEVWIRYDEPTAFDISSRSMTNLQEAMKALNQLIHDLRLLEGHTSSRFLVQPPSRVSSDAKICLELEARPTLEDRGNVSTDPDNGCVVDSFVRQMGPTISAAAETLTGLGKNLQMRINFGRLNVRGKKKGIGSVFTYAEFRDVMKAYSVQGPRGAYLGTK